MSRATTISCLSCVSGLLLWPLTFHCQHRNQCDPVMACLTTTLLCSEPSSGSHLVDIEAEVFPVPFKAPRRSAPVISHSAPRSLPYALAAPATRVSLLLYHLPHLLPPQGLCTSSSSCLGNSLHSYPHGLFLPHCPNVILTKRHPDPLAQWESAGADLTAALLHTCHYPQSADGPPGL